MKASHSTLSCLLALISSLCAAETYTEKFIDPNYALCEGVGVNGSGTVTVNANVERYSDSFEVEWLYVIGNYPNIKETLSASVDYVDSRGSSQTINLSKPWFDTIGQAGTNTLVLPRVMTAANGNPNQEMQRFTAHGGNFTLRVNGYVPGGCTFSFEEVIQP